MENKHEKEFDKVLVYPNPGKGVFYFDVDNISIKLIQIIGTNGLMIKEMMPEAGIHKIELELTGQKPGIYFIRLFSGEQRHYQKLIITE